MLSFLVAKLLQEKADSVLARASAHLQVKPWVGEGRREEAQRSGATSAFSKLRCHLRDMGVVPIITTRAVAAWNVGCVLRKRASALVKRKEKEEISVVYSYILKRFITLIS
ncbi:hypothetical protein CEXT_208741 [Caerostris extrusa]|uniref:Uncharacterized protein n=1 Tax=Caerostris extrusa TaxID=172846 RepID=A0AAV4QTZ4_CAEEX|nr:hypothetical protein CEXT_208741 [Caerostris extrusa]